MWVRELTCLIYQLIALHIFSRLFHGIRGAKYSKEEVFLSAKSAHTSVLFRDMCQPPTLSRRWLYQELKIQTETATYLILIKHHGANELIQTLQQHWIRHHGHHLHAKVKKIETLLSSRYLSQSIQKVVFDVAGSLWCSWKEVDKGILPKALEPMVATIREIASWTENDIAEFQCAFVTYYLGQDVLYFDQVESNPLTLAQRKACIVQDDRQLLLAAAGTGKTSVIKAKLGYLLHRKLANADQVILLAYGNDAATEMRERCNDIANTLNCSTFHSLSMQIIEAVTGTKPVLSTLATDKAQFKLFISDAIQSLRQETHFEQAFHQFLDGQGIKQAQHVIELLSQMLPLIKQAQIMGEVESLIMRFNHQMTVPLAVLAEYQLYLTNEACIDFDDMLERAIHYVENDKFRVPWRYILVDEFQDISRVRAKLVQALLDKKTGSQLFAVGDDWQAIYRFSGGDIRLTTEFAKHFGKSTTTYLDKTFRYPQSILDTACEFICRNPEQIAKDISSNQLGIKGQGVIKVPSGDEIMDAQQLLNLIEQRNEGAVSVLLLARNHKGLPDKAQVDNWRRLFPQLAISTNTFHGAKGTEADFTIVFGLKARLFPSKIKVPEIIEALLPAKGSYADAEERRLFYVALTRARKQCFLLEPDESPSYFLQEIA
ncbi:UvrD-helicase domain-containing protein [Pseudoalteromonas sp. SCSIO 43201]|uniref:UvrD-helicase domain-containing protein n=1 Tax=Pseudoalteromonas sp. SCSIO 43201 TaxID=2822842 RepID=UPI00207666AE|nr:UvrD-helicase domain-containing protein [Pseudoalteromonas sp. SCSIO 43201]USD27211.1 UvrD-helicase domain-containing protein [Pseudoalteromonas sp. SCSIO 43201]